MILKAVGKNGQPVELSRRCTSIQWSGDKGQLAREVTVSVAVSATDPDYASLDLQLFRPFGLYQDDGTQLCSGYIVRVARDSSGDTMEITAMDRGLWLANNQGWYNFPGVTPEAATRTICGDFGIKVGQLPTTGVKIKRKFAGVALHDIIRTLWYKAGEQNGKRYHLTFSGDALTVAEKPGKASAVLAPKVNIDSSSITRDGTGYHNAVAIYSEAGKLIRRIKSDKADFALEGMMQRVIIQRSGENAEADAKAALLDDDIKQTVTVICEGDASLVTGRAVQVQLTAAGVAGLFWIESDTHNWSNGRYTTRLTLNFRNLMQTANAGSDR